MKRLLTGLAILSLSLLLSIPTFAANKSAQFRLKFHPLISTDASVRELLEKINTYSIIATLPKKTRVSKNTTYSGRFLVPADFLAEDGALLSWSVNLDLGKKAGQFNVIGDIQTTMYYNVSNSGGRLHTYYNVIGDPEGHNGANVITVDNLGSYYAITFKNMKAKSVWNNWVDGADGEPLDTKTKYYASPAIYVTGYMPITVKGRIYLDQIKVKTGSTQTITFDKKDYKELWGESDERDLSVKVVATPQ